MYKLFDDDTGIVIRGVTGIFFGGGKVVFPDFFLGVKCFFLVENSHFGRPKTNFRHFQKWKEKKKSSPLFITFSPSISNFPPSLLQFSFFPPQFSPLFPFFLASFYPIRHQKFPRQKSLGGTLPPTCYDTAYEIYAHQPMFTHHNCFLMFPAFIHIALSNGT